MDGKKEQKRVHGYRSEGQKYKSLLVMQYILKHADDEHAVTVGQIMDHLAKYGIEAERRSIYKDIEEINKAILIAEGAAIDVFEAEELCEDEEELSIVYDKHRKGFYVRQRHYDASDIRMMAECVYAARFLDEKTALRLVDVACEQVSIHDAEKIKHNAFLTDRVKTDCTTVYRNVSLINDAMSTKLDGEAHIPEKIKFKYLKCTIQDMKNRVERRHGDEYIVSPYELLINDGNYYLLGFDDKSKKIRTFRVDRMKNLKFTHIPRDGEEEFKKINMSAYAKEHFGMFSGNTEHVTLRFIEPLLDTIVDRFGTTGVVYGKDDDRHLTATVSVAVSDQFFGWVCGFGKRVTITAPESVKEKFKAHLKKIQEKYEMETADT